MSSSLSRPLEGVRVLDLTVALSGPYGSLLLAGLGAEVIRVESPDGGDIARTNPPFVGDEGMHFGAMKPGDVSLTTLNRARNKKSVTLDLKSKKGHELFMRLVKEADVVFENFSEGTAAKLKVDYARVREANPKIIYASIKAFGEPSDRPQLKGMDIIVQALSGIMEVTGEPGGAPTRWGLPIADMVSPLFVVNGILAALIQRGRTGEGQAVTVSMLDCLASMVAGENFDVMTQAGYPLKSGNFQDRLCPFGVYAAKDGAVAIVAFSPEWFRSLVGWIGRTDLLEDARYATRGPRMKHAKEVNALIEAWTREHTTEEIVRELLDKRGVPCARVRSPLEVLDDPVLHERGAVMRIAHPGLGDARPTAMGNPIRMSNANVQFDRPAPNLGESNEQIYGGLLKLSAEELRQLKSEGVI
ncbi:CaiB/BaiF CoA transferase family protein [Ramlibacter sp.]|uniref:CaiB/BaiF CoA transferase family protein n=1 Tax=Ramlibacter sp. TaxID=1917967 RepID=UPI003D097D64